MPFSSIDKPSKYFNTKLYTGDGTGAKAITGVGFQPDLVWLKTRSTAFHHQLHDRVRGATAGAIYSSLTNAQDSNYPITSFDSDGFTLGNSASLIADSFGSQNGSGTTMCSWNWKANGTGVSNTAGSITSTVSASQTSGFSIVRYTGTGANATVGHGLGVAPKMIILKSRTDGAADWRVYHASVGNTGYLQLNATTATTTSSTTWQNTTPTSTVFSIGTSGTVNLNTGNFIAYCFAEVKGFSKAFSYTGNGSADGTFVYTGFKPAFLLIKQSSGAGEYWQIIDNKRDTYNVTFNRLFPNVSDANNTGLNPNIDFLSNGFKCRTASSGTNGSGATFVYMAFADSPFVSSKAIPTTAR